MIKFFKSGKRANSKREYTDVEFVKGVVNHDSYVEQALFKHCKKYFEDNVDGVFFVKDEQDKKEIFQNSYIKLWEHIESKRIDVKDGILIGRDKKPFNGTITTYLMGIAKNKFLEWSRTSQREHRIFNEVNNQSIVIDPIELEFQNNGGVNNIMSEIVSECISKMSKRCSQILTMFYYQNMSLDEIIEALPTYNSKDALKTSKHKCFKRLQKTANEIYYIYLNKSRNYE